MKVNRSFFQSFRLMTNPPVLIGRGLLFIDQTMAKSVLQK